MNISAPIKIAVLLDRSATLRTVRCFLLCALSLLPTFAVSAQFGYSNSNGALIITGYFGNATNLSIPARISGLPVQGIGTSAFANRGKLKMVTIPNGVTTIGNRAFYRCTNLTSVSIGGSVSSIGESAFAGSMLTGVTLPSSVTSIGSFAFNCPNLEAIFVEEGNKVFSSVEGVLLNNGQTELLQYPRVRADAYYIVPGSVTSIGAFAFYLCTNLTGITFGNSVNTVGESAFAGSTLTSVTIPDSVTAIGNSAFRHCNRLTNITIPDSIIIIGESAFAVCDRLTTATIPNSVTSIGANAFSFCSSLATLKIGSGLTNIGDSAFHYCRGLTAITVEESNAFFTSVEGVLFDKDQTDLIQYPVAKEGGSYSIPETVTTIGAFAFFYCPSLTNVIIPNSVITVGESAFAVCTGLTGMTLPEGVITIGNSAFSDCTGLTSVTLPNTVRSIGNFGFQSCAGLTNMIIPNLLTNVGDSVFAYCAGLMSVTIPDSVTVIGDSAFYSCTSLASLLLPNRLVTIGRFAFADSGLTSASIPEGVSDIGDSAFFLCGSLTNLIIPKTLTSIGSSAFKYCVNLRTAYFLGDQPSAPIELFASAYPTVYFLPGTTGWGSSYAGRPAVLWDPAPLKGDAKFDERGKFGFVITGSQNMVVVVEACSDLANAVWLPVRTNVFASGVSYLSDAASSSHESRFYRFRSP